MIRNTLALNEEAPKPKQENEHQNMPGEGNGIKLPKDKMKNRPSEKLRQELWVEVGSESLNTSRRVCRAGSVDYACGCIWPTAYFVNKVLLEHTHTQDAPELGGWSEGGLRALERWPLTRVILTFTTLGRRPALLHFPLL